MLDRNASGRSGGGGIRKTGECQEMRQGATQAATAFPLAWNCGRLPTLPWLRV